MLRTPQEAFYADKISLPLHECEGKVCAEFVLSLIHILGKMKQKEAQTALEQEYAQKQDLLKNVTMVVNGAEHQLDISCLLYTSRCV